MSYCEDIVRGKTNKYFSQFLKKTRVELAPNPGGGRVYEAKPNSNISPLFLLLQDVHLKPQLQLSAGNSTLTTVTNNINGNEINSSATSVDIGNSGTSSNMEPAVESVQSNSATTSALSAAKHNGNGIVDVNLESEERDEFVEIKVRI